MGKKLYVVDHPSLYLMAGGNLQQMEMGAEIELSDAAAKQIGNKIKPKTATPTADVGSGASEVTAEAFAEAVAKLDPETGFTGAGIPDVNALKAVGLDISAAERTTLWEASQAE